jgi:hypothetical protein
VPHSTLLTPGGEHRCGLSSIQRLDILRKAKREKYYEASSVNYCADFQ